MAFDPGDDDEPLGWMNENRHLRAACCRAEAGKNIWLMWKAKRAAVERGDHGVTVRLEDGRVIGAPLLVAAEGRNSPMREAAEIRIARWKYDHSAIVLDASARTAA
jgi:2-octaprenyl-6-methoxyphenol hydroxylase